jgi:hypothetical protein
MAPRNGLTCRRPSASLVGPPDLGARSEGPELYGYPVNSQHLAGAGNSRVHAFPCAMNRASWLVTRIGMSDQKPEPRRHLTS